LWPELDVEAGDTYLSNAAYKLRCVFHQHATLLTTFGDHRDSGYQLAEQSLLWVDADACETLLAEAERVGRLSVEAVSLLEEALHYFERGAFLHTEEGLWCYSRRARLEQLSYRCRIWLAEAYEQQGKVGPAEQQYQTLLEDDPTNEDALRRLMRLHHQQGMTHLALRCYEETKRQAQEAGQKLSPTMHTFAQRLLSKPHNDEMFLGERKPQMPARLSEDDGRQVISQMPSAIVQNSIKEKYLLEDQDIHTILRRQFLQQIFGMAGAVFLTPAFAQYKETGRYQIAVGSIEEILFQAEKNFMACWRLMKGSEIFVVQSVLSTWLPVLDTLIKQPSKLQKKLASLAAQGYILAGLVAVLQRKYDGAEWCCKQAIEYSRLAEDYNLLVASLKHLAAKYNSAKYTLLTLHTYQEALPLVSYVSPLLCSRIYLGLALSYAQCKQKHEADYYFGLAQESFPEYPEDDVSFLYADCGRSSLNHYGGLMYLEFDQPERAWEIFSEVEELKSKIVVPERTLIEIVNCQAEAAVAQQNMELACIHIQAGVAGALRLNSAKRFHDTFSVYQKMCSLWSHEQKVKQLEGLFHQEM
jgi:DNA-binding SARP family transcriptional activator